ncbi:TerB family tellurite resistance protein [Anaerovibrio sp.]|uniref:tellurite resistance TerB family protein n=1 Tax=Anaerovibrio sp. TaxID=1872532 RepID=UPI0025C57001|nr:TerB family tellurite resistance protein [Anaerovibrio sp.]
MFLKKLKPENQEKFLQLSCILCHADGSYSEPERQMMRLYAAEFEREDGVSIIEKIEAEEETHTQAGEKDFQLAYRFRSIIEEVKENSDMKERKIILFELLGLAYADKSFSESENKLIKDAHEALEFKADAFARVNDTKHYFDITEVGDMFTRYIDLQKEMTRYVLS